MRASILSAALLAAAAAFHAAAGEVAPGENLARGKPYTLAPRPDYRHCTDPGDRTQLTDGVYTEGYFWTQETTVGWRNAHPARINVDLGRRQPIRGVSRALRSGSQRRSSGDVARPSASIDSRTAWTGRWDRSTWPQRLRRC